MEKKEKVVFDQYDLHMKKRDYHILIPRYPPKEAYVDPYTDPPYLDGNHVMYKTLRGMVVALIRNPDWIVYLPSRQNGTINYNWPYGIFPTFDVVFCSHVAQLNRHQFERLKDMLPYTRPRQRTIRYDISGFLDYCEKELEAVRKTERYYREEEWKLYKTSTTFYSVGSRYLFCESFGILHHFTAKVNFEAECRKYRSSEWTTLFGFELGYISKSIIRYWDKREK